MHISVANLSTLEQIRKFLTDSGLSWLATADGNPRVGVALSGGADSVALLLVGRGLGWQPVALHCNFQLRGEESTRDEKFVIDLCGSLGVDLKIVRFDVKSRIEQTGESVEMACRSLRYNWFAEMANQLRLKAVAVGHHRDDNIETLLLNALRGCGLAGVKGIPIMRDIYVRPLLAISRAEILRFLQNEGVSYVTDSTNYESLFSRNKIRNEILPLIERLFPGAESRLADTVGMLNADYQLFRDLVNSKRREYVSESGVVNLAAILQNESQALTLLYHLLDGEIDIERLRLMVDQSGSSGKIYQARSGRRYLLNRGRLIPLAAESEQEAPIGYNLRLDRSQLGPEPVSIVPGNDAVGITARLIGRAQFRPLRNPAYAWFDADALLADDLVVRHPRRGDYIHPFGMQGRQLLSDLFSDNKLSAIEKAQQWVLANNDEIVWVAGLRNSRLYPVTSQTANILELHAVDFAKK